MIIARGPWNGWRLAIARLSLALSLASGACSGGAERAPASDERATAAASSAPATTATGEHGASGAPVVAPGTLEAPTTSIGLVDAFPSEVDWPVVPATDAHDGILPPGVLPDDFAILVRARIGAAPFVELRPRAGMPGRWELVAADAETPEDPSVDLSESLVWSVEVPTRRVAGLYAFVLGHPESLPCTDSAGLPARYARRSSRLACNDDPEALGLRARLDQLVADLAP